LATSTVFARLGWASGNGVKVIAFVVIAGIVVYTGVVGFDLLMRIQTWITVISLGLTVLYIAFTIDDVDWSAITAIPSGSAQAFIGATIFAMTGFGIGWVNCGADYSRYLPRKASGRGIFGWTVFGASISPVILVVYGLLLAASDPELLAAIGTDPIGALTTILPTSALVLLSFLIVVSLGFIGGAVLDIYSSGLALLVLGLRVPRPVAAGVDGVLMVLGTIYVVWVADTFFVAFQGFLYTLGVPMAAWVGIFLADMALRRSPYNDQDLYDPRGRYGVVNGPAVVILVIATAVGWGLVTNFNADWLTWQGYLLDPLGLGPKGTVDTPGPWTFANIGIVVALALGFVGALVFSRSAVRRQERITA
jgi:purine-cytosine permease-like protein